MIKRISFVVVTTIICLILSSCWSYRGIETMDIVSGIAIDIDDKTGDYLLTVEIIDSKAVNSNAESVTKYIETQGETIYSAIRSSNQLFTKKLFGGNMKLLIVSQQIAKNEGIKLVLEELLRVGDPRETMCLAISKGETAKEILLSEPLGSQIISFDIYDTIESDNASVGSTKDITLFHAYELLEEPGCSLVLPALQLTENNEKKIAKTNGIALFDGDFLKGFETPINTFYYLLSINELKSCAYSLPYESGHISIEIMKNITKQDVVYQNGKLKVSLNLEVDFKIVETESLLKITSINNRKDLENFIGDKMEEKLMEFLKNTQSNVSFDIFSFGRKIYQNKPNLWRSIEKNWNAIYNEASFNVIVKTHLKSSGVISNY